MRSLKKVPISRILKNTSRTKTLSSLVKSCWIAKPLERELKKMLSCFPTGLLYSRWKNRRHGRRLKKQRRKRSRSWIKERETKNFLRRRKKGDKRKLWKRGCFRRGIIKWKELFRMESRKGELSTSRRSKKMPNIRNIARLSIENWSKCNEDKSNWRIRVSSKWFETKRGRLKRSVA